MQVRNNSRKEGITSIEMNNNVVVVYANLRVEWILVDQQGKRGGGREGWDFGRPQTEVAEGERRTEREDTPPRELEHELKF